jgi:hypothetical protein
MKRHIKPFSVPAISQDRKNARMRTSPVKPLERPFAAILGTLPWQAVDFSLDSPFH